MAKGAKVMRTAVVLSILAHASLIGAAGLRKQPPVPEEPPPVADVWAGTTSLPVGSEELVDVDTLGGSAPQTPPAPTPTPAMPSGADTQDEAPVEAPKPPVVPEKPVPKDKPAVEKPAQKAPAKAPETPKPQAEKPEKEEHKAADKQPESTSEKPDAQPEANDPKDPASADRDKPTAPDKPVAQDEPAPEPEKKPAKTAKHAKPTAPVPASAASAEAAPDASAKAPGGGSFGAEGAPSVRDLGRAFTRALPPACDSDKTWATLPAGSAGAVEVVVNISDEGRITGFEPITKDPPRHLTNAVKRTLALLQGGVFAIAGGSVTAGQQVLRLSVELSDTTVSEEDASGAAAFGLASRWEGKKGVASFTQMSGRHVEITVEFVRVLPPKP